MSEKIYTLRTLSKMVDEHREALEMLVGVTETIVDHLQNTQGTKVATEELRHLMEKLRR